MSAQVYIALLVGLAAVIDDLSRRQISNWICVAALAGGLGWQIGQYGWQGLLYGLAGTVVGFSSFLVFYLLGGMGGGDVKLMAGFGALLGTSRLVEAALWTAGIGGLIALTVVLYREVAKRFGHKSKSNAGFTPDQQKREASIPYAPAIALGVWLSLVPRGL